MKPISFVAISAASLISASTFAESVNKALTIKATVPPTLDWTRADGSVLHGELEMKYVAGTGLKLDPISTKIHSNHPTANFHVSLDSDTVELQRTGGIQRIPLEISLNNSKLSTTPILLEATEIFPNGTITDQSVSKELPLHVRQSTPGALLPGDYIGTVNLVLSHTL